MIKLIVKFTMVVLAIASSLFAIYAYFNPISGSFHFTKSDEVMHITGFAIVSFLLAIGFSSYSRPKLVLWLCLVGIFVEIAQPLLTTRRELSHSDIVANWLGVLLGVCISMVLLTLFSVLSRWYNFRKSRAKASEQ